MSTDSISKRILDKGPETFLKNQERIFLKYEFGYWQTVQNVIKESNKNLGRAYKEFIVLRRFFTYYSAEKHILSKMVTS